jgi:hypothetical protein
MKEFVAKSDAKKPVGKLRRRGVGGCKGRIILKPVLKKQD